MLFYYFFYSGSVNFPSRMKRRTLFSHSAGRLLVAAMILALIRATALYAAPGTLRTTVPIGDISSVTRSAAFDATGRFIFVADSGADQISIIDRWRYQVRSTFNLLTGCQPSNLLLAGGLLDRLYISCPGLDRVEILDAAGVEGDSPELSRLLPTGLAVGDAPGPLAYHQSADRVIVANQGSAKNVSVIDNSTGTPVKTHDITVCSGNDPNGIGIGSNGRAYVPCANGTISVIDGFPAAPAFVTSLGPGPLSGFIPHEIITLSGDYLYVAYTDASGTDTGFVAIQASDSTICTNRQSIGSGAVAMTAFTDNDNSPDKLLGFFTDFGAARSMVYVDIDTIEAGACPPPGPPSLLTQTITIPTGFPLDPGRLRIAYHSSLMAIPSRRGHLYAVSSAPLFINDTSSLPFISYNNVIGSDPVTDPEALDGDKPIISIEAPYTLADGSNLNLASMAVTLHPSGEPLSLSGVATVDGGSIVLDTATVDSLTQSQVVEIKITANSNTLETTTQLLRVARLDIDRPAVPQPPEAVSTGVSVVVNIPITDDTCPLLPPADCTGLESGPDQVISGTATYIVRIQSASDPSKVFIVATPSMEREVTVNVGTAGLGLTETWLVAVASRDGAGNRSATYSFQSQSRLLRVGSLALFGEDGGFGCSSGSTGAPLLVFVLLIASLAVSRASNRSQSK